MSTIDPSKITAVKLRGSLIGRILTVGKDGDIYTYNYNHPQTAYNSANSGDIILIYPGVYDSIGVTNCLILNRNININIRGMGDLPDDVVLHTPDTTSTYTGIVISHTADNININIENLRVVADKAWGQGVSISNGTASSNVYLNKIYLHAPYLGYVVSFSTYLGNCYITNCTNHRGYANFYRVGQASSTSIISVTKMYYAAGAYYCDSCSRPPSPNDYVTTTSNGYGHLYGKYLFEIMTLPLYRASSTVKKNIWFKSPYVYKPTTSGVNVYDLSSETLVKTILFSNETNSVWANDDYLYIATSNSGIYRCAINTISGTPIIEEYKNLPDITSNTVNYIHGNGDYLCTATTSGVDRYKLSDDTREYTTQNYVTKCFQTTNGDYYYVVNPSTPILGLDDSIFGWNYGRKVTLSATASGDNYSFLFEIPMTQPDEIYRQAAHDGVDLRIVDNTGVSLPFYIDSWNYTTPPVIYTTLYSGTNSLYVLYNNPKIQFGYSAPYNSLFTYLNTHSGCIVGREQSTKDLFDSAELHAVYNDGGEYTYKAEQNGLIFSVYISDVYITENTSTFGNGNVIFLSTSYGATVIEEKRGDESNSQKKIYLVET
jgi:hypothetical protein